MADYERVANAATIRRTADGVFIAEDMRSEDWRNYVDWLAEGNEPDPAPVPPPVIQPLTVDDLAAILVKKLVLSQSDITKK